MSNCIVAGCDRQVHGRGRCKSHWAKAYRAGEFVSPKRGRTLEERFWAKVEKTDTCWNWTGAIMTAGYGHINPCDGTGNLRAHRLSYEWAKGPIPEGMFIDHACHNRRCVNPDHLRLATNKQNVENHSGARRDSRSGVRGVNWDEGRQRWRATVRHAGHQYSAGYHKTLESAEAAVVAKRLELHTYNDIDRIAS